MSVSRNNYQLGKSYSFDKKPTIRILDLTAHVALNLFTNYVNVAFNTPLDFPAVALRRAA